jgi:hypothetical protein
VCAFVNLLRWRTTNTAPIKVRLPSKTRAEKTEAIFAEMLAGKFPTQKKRIKPETEEGY